MPSTPTMPRRALAFALSLSLLLGTTSCRDMIRVHSHPPGAELVVDGRPCGTIPEGGLSVDVKWWTFSRHRARLTWPDGRTVSADFRKSVGDPDHPEYLVLDGILALFFIVPGVVAFCVNGVGPEPHQHFTAPVRPPAAEPAPAREPERRPEPAPEPAKKADPVPLPEPSPSG